jgi:hypothetical protein
MRSARLRDKGTLRMFVFVGDESNVTQSRQARFFIYGGLIIAADKASEATKRITSVRTKYGFPQDAEFKFDSRSRPADMSNAQFLQAKNEVLTACAELEVRFMAYAVHHGIATKQRSDLWLWALNTLLCQFDLFLQREKSYGICLVDRFENDMSLLRRIHQQGVDPEFWGGRLPHKLENVWCYGTINIGTTHAASMVDIVLGAFRYCVNEMVRKNAPLALYKKVRPLMLCEPGNPAKVKEWGLFLRPKEIKAASYKQEYDALLQHLESLE